MSRGMVPPDYAELFPWLTEQGQASQAEFIAQFQDLCSRSMDRALGLQESSFDQATQLQSQALELCRKAIGFPMLGDFFKMGAEFLTACMELQMKAITLMFSGRVPVASAPAGHPAEAQAMEMASMLRKRPEAERKMPAPGVQASN
jgi:hypothetical protein